MTTTLPLLLLAAAIPVTLAQPQIQNVIGGTYSQNLTLFYRNQPFRVSKDIVVEPGATLTIETGVKMYFDPGVGITVRGSLFAVVCSFFFV